MAASHVLHTAARSRPHQVWRYSTYVPSTPTGI